jgi:ligand-binding sensor domain-containing protein
MKKNIFALLILLAFSTVFSQSQQLWKGYFSYNEIKDLSESPDKIYVASENALFTKNNLSGEIKTYNTIDGLSGQTISAMYHSETFKKTIFGYENGLMVVRNEIDGSVLNVVDIINKAIPQNVKKVNHFMEYQGILYVSCDFGIVQYNLATLQFGDTYFIGNGGSQIIVNQTAIFEDKIYAATQNFGIKNASISNANLNDYNQWTTMDGNGWKGIVSFDDKLLAITLNGNIQKFQSGVFINQNSVAQNPIDFRVNDNHLIVTTQNHVYVYNSNLSQILDINSTQITAENSIIFSCATVIDEKVFVGTKENGIFKTAITNGVTFENIIPSGPSYNAVFSVTNNSKTIWTVYGGHDEKYTPFYKKSGFDKYTFEKGWINIPSSQTNNSYDLTRITINPNNTKQYYISTFYSGLLKYDNDILTTQYTTLNSGLESVAANSTVDIRVEQSAFDSLGNLWMTNCFVNNAIKVFKTNGVWNKYNLDGIISKRFGRMAIDKNNTKWITSRQDGILGFNETNGIKLIKIMDGSNGNLPVATTQAVAVDTKGQLWIGTTSGLRVLSSVDSFLNNTTLSTEAIIILEDGLAQELLYEQNITDIVVDGANNKWIATLDAGVFQVSPDGQKTLLHFTTTNSPLPTNAINDIEIDSITGEVYIATNKGMVSYKGTATDASENLENVYIYPNPVRPEFSGTVKISGLLDKATVKITDIGGNLVYETTSEGGTIEWDTTAFGKYKVASGVYMVLISAEDGVETKVKKVMIIR